ncbi:MAG: hypothetical protein AAF809_11635 [Bacteroidota bacterium]
MDQATVALILGLAGILSGFLTGAVGLFLSSRARSTPLRQYLFQQQIELGRRLGVVIGRIRLMPSIIRLSDDPDHRQQASADLRSELAELEVLYTEASGILPTDVFVEISKLISAIFDFLKAYDEGVVDQGHQEAIGGHAVRTLLVFRTALGIDMLSDRNMKLFDKPKNIKTLIDLDAPTLGRIAGRSGFPASS